MLISLLVLVIMLLGFRFNPFLSLPRDFLHIINFLVGFYFAVVVGHYIITEIVANMWIAATGRKDDPVSPFDTSAIIGWVERSFYIVFLLLGKPEVIGFWLTLKTAGRIWGEERPAKKTICNDNSPPTRTIYQIFLIGNALSIGYAVVGWKIIVWLPKTPAYAVLSIISLCAGSLILCQIIKKWGVKHWRDKVLMSVCNL